MHAEHRGDKWETIVKSCRAEHPGSSGRQVGDKGVKWETNVKSCGLSIQGLVGDRRETRRDKSETNVKSHGPSIQSLAGKRGDERGQVGDECKITRAEHPESSGRQVGDKNRQARQM